MPRLDTVDHPAQQPTRLAVGLGAAAVLDADKAAVRTMVDGLGVAGLYHWQLRLLRLRRPYMQTRPCRGEVGQT